MDEYTQGLLADGCPHEALAGLVPDRVTAWVQRVVAEAEAYATDPTALAIYKAGLKAIEALHPSYAMLIEWVLTRLPA